MNFGWLKSGKVRGVVKRVLEVGATLTWFWRLSDLEAPEGPHRL